MKNFPFLKFSAIFYANYSCTLTLSYLFINYILRKWYKSKAIRVTPMIPDIDVAITLTKASRKTVLIITAFIVSLIKFRNKVFDPNIPWNNFLNFLL